MNYKKDYSNQIRNICNICIHLINQINNVLVSESFLYVKLNSKSFNLINHVCAFQYFCYFIRCVLKFVFFYIFCSLLSYHIAKQNAEFSLPQEIADKIGRMVMNKFEQLIAGHAQHSRRKVILFLS